MKAKIEVDISELLMMAVIVLPSLCFFLALEHLPNVIVATVYIVLSLLIIQLTLTDDYLRGQNANL